MDDTNPNLQMVLINNEYYAIDQEIFPSLPAPAQPLQPLPQRATNPRKSKSPGTTLPAKRALPFVHLYFFIRFSITNSDQRTTAWF